MWRGEGEWRGTWLGAEDWRLGGGPSEWYCCYRGGLERALDLLLNN